MLLRRGEPGDGARAAELRAAAMQAAEALGMPLVLQKLCELDTPQARVPGAEPDAMPIGPRGRFLDGVLRGRDESGA